MSSHYPPTKIPPRASALKQRQTIDDETIIQQQRPRRTADDTHLTPRSAIRYQPQPIIPQQQYVIPLTNGKIMRVTERELADLPEDYQEAAQPLATPQVQQQPAEPETQRPTMVKKRRRVRFHWLVFVGIGLFVMIIGWLTFSALSSWWSVQQDDWHYGRPRTFQTDQVVGHNGDSQAHPSHFIALNLNGHVEVIEFPAGDGSKARIYLGPQLFGNGEDLAAVTLSFEDRNNDGKPDLNIHIEGSDKVIVFLNDGKAFKPAPNQQ